MSDGLLVNHAALSATAQQLLGTATRIDGRLDALEGQLTTLRNGWTGSAQEAYLQAKATWDAAIADVIGILRDSGSLVEASNGEYRAADLRGAARFS